MSNLLISLALIIICPKLMSQEDWGGKIGINFQFGTHVQRLGLMYQVYYFKDNISLSHASFLRWNKKSLGPESSYFEAKLQFGLQGQWLPTTINKYLMNDYSNMSPYLNSLGYNFYVYFDEKNMSQTTGALYGNAADFMWAVENDALGANQVDDKYRTGGFYFAYQSDSLLLGIQSVLWTANSSMAPKIPDTTYPSRFGYRDISKVTYANKSHGIFSVTAMYKMQFDQVVKADLGVDSEGIRHALQNKLIHDGLSKRFVKSESAHYPMLQEDGSMFLFKEGQKRRKPQPYLQIGANEGTFY